MLIPGHDVVAVQIERQVDEIVDVADLIAASLHMATSFSPDRSGKARQSRRRGS